MNFSFPMMSPFYAEKRSDYEIKYLGVQDSTVGNYLCHKFSVESKTEDEKNINGEYYFDADSFRLVRVDFTPAKKKGNLFFKMKKLAMTLKYAPDTNGYWFPTQFDISGEGKAMFFIGVNFTATEYFRNPKVNTLETEAAVQE